MEDSVAQIYLRDIDLRCQLQTNYRPVRERSERPELGEALTFALENAARAHELIEGEQELLRDLLADEIRGGNDDPKWIKGREYQIWLVGEQLRRATDLATERLRYFAQIRTGEHIKTEEERCRQDKHHWFRYYAWGFDPRPDSPLNTIPIAPFDFQTRYLDWLDHLVFRTRQGGVAPKSRDMGATEWALRWAIYHWKYRDSFEVLLLSRTEDEVDSKKDVNTLFEKVRFQIRLVPTWMLPEGFDLDRGMPYMLIQNPVNRSTFHGRAPTENVGRQLRVATVIYDEKAFAPNGGYKQHTALAQTSKSLIDISSVGGRLNKFADRMTDGMTPQFVMDWREHPWKTAEWYNALKTGVFGTAMTDQEIAQEIDRDLDASQPGKVWSLREEYVFMTWAEVVEAFDKFGFGKKFQELDYSGNLKRYVIPDDWRWMRYHDKGATEGHQFAYTLAAKPTAFYPYSDTVFVFVSQNLTPVGLTTEQAFAQWREFERELGLRNDEYKFIREPYSSKNSHEQKNLRKVLREEYGDNWAPWDTDYIAGIEQMQVWFNIIDQTKPNPFRPELNGRCRIIFVAPNDEYQLAFNQMNGTHYLTNSKTERGFLTARKQYPAYHYPEEERGKALKDMRPFKFFDDIVDTGRALAVDEVRARSMTKAEDTETRMPDHLKTAAIAEQYGQDGFVELMMARLQEERQIEIRRQEEERAVQERANQVLGGKRAVLLGRRKR